MSGIPGIGEASQYHIPFPIQAKPDSVPLSRNGSRSPDVTVFYPVLGDEIDISDENDKWGQVRSQLVKFFYVFTYELIVVEWQAVCHDTKLKPLIYLPLSSVDHESNHRRTQYNYYNYCCNVRPAQAR